MKVTPPRRQRFHAVSVTLLALSVAVSVAVGALAQAPPAPPDVKAPQPTVPEIYTLMGQYVRVAYNNEGFAVLGYRIANGSVGEEWMYLQAGLTVLRPTKDYTLKREAISIKTPDGQTIPLATQKEYMEAGGLRALNARSKAQKDSINYFPVEVTRGCAMQFFADLGGGNSLAYDQVDLSSNRACAGRLFFKVPGGIKTGQHWLVIQFEKSRVEVPFRILTEEEEKYFRKNWEDLKKQLDETMSK